MGHDAEKVASEGREQVCHSCYQLATGPLLLHTCRWATLLLLPGSREEEEEEEAALPPETHLDFLPAELQRWQRRKWPG